MFYAIKERRPKTAQQSFLKFQYSMIICTLGLFVIIWSVDPDIYLDYPYGLLIFSALTIIPGSHLGGGFAIMRAFRESERLAREKICNASEISEEANPHVRDFLKQNETLQAEVLKYDEQLERYGVKVYRCWLKFVAIFEVLRICGYLLFTITTLIPHGENVPGQSYAVIALFLSSLLRLYSCFKPENAIAKKLALNSERAVIALKVCILVSIISYLFLARGSIVFSDEQDVPLAGLVSLDLVLGLQLLRGRDGQCQEEHNLLCQNFSR